MRTKRVSEAHMLVFPGCSGHSASYLFYAVSPDTDEYLTYNTARSDVEALLLQSE